jgi:hypothetical protein
LENIHPDFHLVKQNLFWQIWQQQKKKWAAKKKKNGRVLFDNDRPMA